MILRYYHPIAYYYKLASHHICDAYNIIIECTAACLYFHVVCIIRHQTSQIKRPIKARNLASKTEHLERLFIAVPVTQQQVAS